LAAAPFRFAIPARIKHVAAPMARLRCCNRWFWRSSLLTLLRWRIEERVLRDEADPNEDKDRPSKIAAPRRADGAHDGCRSQCGFPAADHEGPAEFEHRRGRRSIRNS